MPPQHTAKTEVVMNTAVPVRSALQAGDVDGHVTYSQVNIKVKVVTDLVKNISMLSDMEPESVLRFLIRAKQVCDLKLVTCVISSSPAH
jgi:hypothetical protein